MKTKFLTQITCGATLVIALSACNGGSKQKETSDSTSIATDTSLKATPDAGKLKPKEAAPAWGSELKPEMQAVMEKLASYGDKPIPELTAVEARKNHTPTDAVKDLIKENNISMPVFALDTTGKDIPVNGGYIHLRVYTPKNVSGTLPIIVYYHGGGFVIANLDVYDASARVLSDKVGAIVVSVAYRLAPEHKFPVAHNDSFAAYQWVVKNAASLKGDPKMIAVAGESAGGNLAINMAIMARDKGITVPKHILAVYPVGRLRYEYRILSEKCSCQTIG